VFGCGYRKVADQARSATTIRDRRDQWMTLGIFATLELLVLGAYDRMVGLELADLAVDGCITKAPCGGDAAGRSPVDRGKQGRKRSTVVEARGIPLGAVSAGANTHDSPLLAPTLDTLERLGPLPERLRVLAALRRLFEGNPWMPAPASL
jgi:transposase